MSADAWLDVKGAAARVLGSEATVLRAARKGTLRGYKLGSKCWRFRPEDVDAWLMRATTPVLVVPRNREHSGVA